MLHRIGAPVPYERPRTEPDEALRRATCPTPALHVLTRVADRLDAEQPDEPMTDGILLGAIHAIANPHSSAAAVDRRRTSDARAAAPEIANGVTCREYAAALRLAAAGVSL